MQNVAEKCDEVLYIKFNRNKYKCMTKGKSFVYYLFYGEMWRNVTKCCKIQEIEMWFFVLLNSIDFLAELL